MGRLCEGRRPLGGPNREVTAPPSEAAAARYGGPGAAPLHAAPPSALPTGPRGISLHRVLCSGLAVSRRALIKSLPGQKPRAGSNLLAFNQENRPETGEGWPSPGELSRPARPGPARSWLVSRSSLGLCGVRPLGSPTPRTLVLWARKPF